MQQDFYKNILIRQGIEVIVPNDDDVDVVNRVIYDELCLGKIFEKSKAAYLDIIHKRARNGSQGIILGCTEIGLLIQQSDTDIPLFDTTLIHAEQAALKSLE